MAGTRASSAPWRVACIQTRTGCDPAENLALLIPLVREAAAKGASYVQTPEMSNVFEAGGRRQYERARAMEEDAMVATMRRLASELGVAVHLGSVAVRGRRRTGRREARQPRGPHRAFGQDRGDLRQDSTSSTPTRRTASATGNRAATSAATGW